MGIDLTSHTSQLNTAESIDAIQDAIRRETNHMIRTMQAEHVRLNHVDVISFENNLRIRLIELMSRDLGMNVSVPENGVV